MDQNNEQIIQKKTKELRVNIFFGISIIIKYYYCFDFMLVNNIFDKIYVSVDYKTLKYHRNITNDKYYDDYVIFLNYINEHSNIIIEKKQKYKLMSITELSDKFEIPIKFKILNKLISTNNKNNNQIHTNYITISTKILNIKKEEYDKFKHAMFDRLNMFGGKIVILGERFITECTEYKIHDTYSIYRDLLANINNYLDLTIENNEHNAQLGSLLQTFNLYHKSDLNIFIGNSGVSELLAYTSSNIIGLTYKKNVLDKTNYLYKELKNINIFNNWSEFISALDNHSLFDSKKL